MRVLKRADAMASLLTGKNAVVTGANRGIGAAILAEFAAQGANVWACARREEPCFLEMCARLTQEHGVWIEPVIFDLADEDGIKAGVQQIRIGKKPVDILVNNAGVIPENRLFLMADPAEMQRVFAVNFFAAMQLTQRVAKLMVRQKAGAIVNICSIAALDGENLPRSLAHTAFVSMVSRRDRRGRICSPRWRRGCAAAWRRRRSSIVLQSRRRLPPLLYFLHRIWRAI